MDDIISSIEKSVRDNNWYSALICSLTLPDICSKIEGGVESTSIRYPRWFNNYLGEKKYKNFLTGNDCYALRCSFLHEGSDNIEEQSKREVLDRVVFMVGGSHLTKFGNCNFGGSKYDNKSFLVLNVNVFCKDMIEAVRLWLQDKTVKKDFSEILKIYQDGFKIGNAIKIG